MYAREQEVMPLIRRQQLMAHVRKSLFGMLLAIFGCSQPVREHVTSEGFAIVGGGDTPYDAAMRAEKFTLAEELAEKMVRDEPRSHLAHIALAHAQLSQGKYPDATSNYEKAIELDPHNTIALYGRGLVAQEQEDFETAKRFYERTLSIGADSPEAYYGMAAACEGLGNHRLVIEHAERFLDINPDSTLAAEARDMINVAKAEIAADR